jgi:hypothetical protein
MSVNDSEGNSSAFCIISHQANNGFELVRISDGNDCSWFAQWGVFSAKFKQKFNIDCRTLPGFTLMAAARKSDHVRAQFDLAEFIRTATIEQITASKTQIADHSRYTTGPASGKRMRQPKDKIPAGTFRATT